MTQRFAVAAVFEPVQAPTTFEETVERLGSAIRLGLLGPGTRLPPERELADQLGISRSTLRQAITTLVQTGHLKSLRGRTGGTFVVERPPLAEDSTAPLPDDWHDALDLRLGVETGAVLLAAGRAGADDLRRLDALVATMAGPLPFARYRHADVSFHIGLAEAAHSARLVQAMTETQAEVSELIGRIPHPETVLQHANGEHARIVAALRARDGEEAVRLIARHLEGTGHILAAFAPTAQPSSVAAPAGR